ncbi:MAG: SDR family oxidoreductase [Alphaproteobacteria bacterium]|nr:SDR family oxidoreductase [Alphaproteobacteria bacterium]
MRFKNKTVIITGGAKGIGKACAIRFAEEGANIFIADIDHEAGIKTAEELVQKGCHAYFMLANIEDKYDCTLIITEAHKIFHRIDVLINNAAILKSNNFLDFDIDDLEKTLKINLIAPFILTQLVANYMIEHNIHGSIINMSSVNAVLAIPNVSAYVIAKGGLSQLTKVAAISLADKSIRVNAIGPGSIMTDMLKTTMSDEVARHKILSRTPMGRAGDPKEIASIAAFLASEDASYITGQTIYADGGRMGLNYTV